GILTHHLGLFAPKLEKICREAEERLQKNSDAVSAHQVFYRLMYRLAPELKTIFCGGQEFGSLKELGEAAISNAVSGNTGFASSLRLLQSSFLYFYAKAILKNDTAAYILWNVNDLISLWQCTRGQCTDVQVSWILGYALSDKRNLRIDDREFSNIAELWEYLMKLEIEQGDSGYIKYLWDHRQDLEFFVAATPKSKCVAEEKYVQALKVLLEELDSMAVFGECEFQFRHFWEFDDYAEKLLSEKQTGRLSKILNIYGLALKEVSEKVWQSDSYENLRRIVSGFAVFEGQLFASVPDFEAYLKEHRDNPELFKKYLKTENSVLTDAEINTLSHRVLHKVSVNSCYRPYDSDETETPKAITVNGIRYPAPLRVKAGEYIKFGRYPHTERYILTKDKKDKEPIEWLVLEVNGNEALLVSRYALDCCPYNDDWMGEITWEECFLRRFLNIEFLTRAFSGEEMRRIKLSEVVNDNNPDFGVSGGNNTRDRIFCLSLTEARCYFKNIAERQCQVTEYARCQGAWTMNDGYGMWWLRSPSSSQEAAAFVLKDGSLSLDSNGYGMFRTKVAVRPALRLIWNL
ncbi:DUF6273 domain-containing protein, partial [Succinimonas sp.]|uniref:DUF6273 domain-containing protein n=1 Tax=Succinimonas sp. TaxID=1936151 RepID=UPI00386BA281